MSTATRDAAAAEIRFVHNTYYTRGAIAFARRNADRVTSLGAYPATNFASIRMYSQLRDLALLLGVKIAEIAMLPCSLTKLVISFHTVHIDWETFRPLCCLQELQVYILGKEADSRFQLNDSFATALPLLRVFCVIPAIRKMALKTTAKVVLPHLVEFEIFNMNTVHLDMRFMSALKSLSLVDCNVSTVSAACSTMILESCWMREVAVLVSPNLRSLTIDGGGVHKLAGSTCRHALSILCKTSSVEWIGATPSKEIA